MILRVRNKIPVTWLLCAIFLLPACSPPDIDPDWAAEELYDYGIGKLEREDWTDALDAFRAITLSHSGSDIVDDALYHQGEMHIKLKEYPLAVVVFRRLISDFPQSPFSDESQYKMAYATFLQSNPAHLTQDKTFEAIRELQFFLEEYPDSEWSAEVHELLQECFDKVAEKDYRIGNLYYKMKDWEAARLYYSELLEAYPMSNWASEAQYEIAESYAREGKLREAIEQYEIYIQSYPENERSAEAGYRLEDLRRIYVELPVSPEPPSVESGADETPVSTDGSAPAESGADDAPISTDGSAPAESGTNDDPDSTDGSAPAESGSGGTP